MRWLALIVAAAVAAPRLAVAAPRLGIIDVPDDLDRALRVTLEPWGISVEVLGGAPPGGDAVATRRAVAELARRAGLDGLLWVSVEGDGVALWMFDADTGELSVRAIPATRDPATAAALALAAKAMLRTTAVAPPPERFGAAPLAEPSPGRLRFQASLGARPLEGGEPRLEIGLSWWPHRLRGRAGVALGVVSGPGVKLDDARLLARYSDTSIHAGARGRLGLSSRLALEAGVGLAAHVTALHGYSPVHGIGVRAERNNAAVDLGLGLGVELRPRVELALEGTLDVALRHQRYLIGGEPVFEVPAAELRGAVALRVNIP